MKPKIFAFVFGCFLNSSCTTQDVGSAGMSAVVVASVLVTPVAGPVAAIYNAAKDDQHWLSNPYIYKIGDSTYAIWNALGWFTDRSELSAQQSNMSAWVIDVTKEKKDKNGVIMLSEVNLDRWYFRDHDRKKLQEIPSGKPTAESADYWNQQAGRSTVTLVTKAESYTFSLKQR
jgi:hypothetical protein